MRIFKRESDFRMRGKNCNWMWTSGKDVCSIWRSQGEELCFVEFKSIEHLFNRKNIKNFNGFPIEKSLFYSQWNRHSLET
jgi:hypothetical protein